MRYDALVGKEKPGSSPTARVFIGGIWLKISALPTASYERVDVGGGGFQGLGHALAAGKGGAQSPHPPIG
jgi:hypothetical protein